MRLFMVLSCSLLLHSTATSSSSTPKPHHDYAPEQDASASNSSYYSTREMRDKCLKEWGGKTKEVQEYFDQVPSEEFKENSEDLKFKLYYERKGLENIDTNEVWNITPPVRHVAGPEYTIEVNDSYVPKYRVTTSEEKRMEEEGTFYSPSSESDSDSELAEVKVTTEPPDTSGQTRGGKKGKIGKKPWPPHMIPKGKRKKRKKGKFQGAQTKRKEQLAAKINGLSRVNPKRKNVIKENENINSRFQINKGQVIVANVNIKKQSQTGRRDIDETGIIQAKDDFGIKTNNMGVRNSKTSSLRKEIKSLQHSKNVNKLNVINPTLEERKHLTPELELKTNNAQRKQKNLSMFERFMGVCKLRHRHKLDHEHLRPRHSGPGNPYLQPHL